MAKSEVKKSAGKVAKKAPRAKQALKRMVSEIDAEDASECAYCFARVASIACCNVCLWAAAIQRTMCLGQACVLVSSLALQQSCWQSYSNIGSPGNAFPMTMSQVREGHIVFPALYMPIGCVDVS